MAENRDLRTPEERAHAVLSASGSHRWIHCPGSVALSIRVDNTLKRGQSIYAAEGSAAHFLCEHCLEVGKSPKDFLNMKIVPEGPLFDAKKSDADISKETGHLYVFVVTEEMVDAVQDYLDVIESIRKSCMFDREEFIEREGNLRDLWKAVSGEVPTHPWLKNMFGTSDFILEAFIDGVLHIVDFKYGAGIAVDPDENSQLMYYAAAYAGSNLPMYDEVHLHIVQPRAYHYLGGHRVWKTTGTFIYDFFKDTAFPAAETTVYVDSILAEIDQDIMDGLYSPEEYEHLLQDKLPEIAEYLHAHPEACQWCDAIHTCPRFREQMVANAGKDFMVDNPPAKATELPLPSTAEQLKKALEWAPMLKKWLSTVDTLADNFTLNGHNIPGFKRVNKRATRRYLDESKVIALCKKKRLKKNEYIVEKLLTPAQLEKILGKETLKDYTISESSGTTVVPTTDKRPEVRISAAADFADDDEDDELAIPGK